MCAPCEKKYGVKSISKPAAVHKLAKVCISDMHPHVSSSQKTIFRWMFLHQLCFLQRPQLAIISKFLCLRNIDDISYVLIAELQNRFQEVLGHSLVLKKQKCFRNVCSVPNLKWLLYP